jgi:hypothetical protein
MAATKKVTIIGKQRFDEGKFHGWRYQFAIAGERFQARVYDELPNRAIVVEPTTTTARQSPAAKHIVRFLQNQGHTEVQFYFGPEGLYRTVDPETLEFICPTTTIRPIRPIRQISPIHPVRHICLIRPIRLILRASPRFREKRPFY